jgi:hypothetical protein
MLRHVDCERLHNLTHAVSLADLPERLDDAAN